MSTNNRISNLVNTQVPFFVRSDHQTFVAFLEAYYEYLEQTQTILNQGKVVERAENLLNYIDVDKTLPEFSEKLYKTFLSLLPKNINTDKEIIIKNIQDFYRAKGTEKALKFLLRILTDGEDSNIYYPKVDILRASAGKWYIQKSLRVRDITVANVANTNRTGLDLFTSRLVRGSKSNASAVIERTDRYYESGLEVNELVISNDLGNFKNDETIYTTIVDDSGTYNVTANVFGGINAITITNPGTGYSVGNTIVFESNSGSGANAYISKVSVGNISSMSIDHGGAGFIANGNILFSGGGGTGANATYLNIDTSEKYHPNTYNIFTSVIQVVSNTTLNTANYTNLNHSQVITPNANTYLINALSSFVFGPCGPIMGVHLNNRGSDYVSVPIADAIANSIVKSIGILGRMEIISKGTGYTAGDIIEFWTETGYGANAIVSSVLGNGAINTVSFTSNSGWIIGGQGYSQSSLPTLNIRSSSGSGGIITANAILGDGETFNMETSTIGAIEEITVTARGDGYAEPPTINLAHAGDGTAQAAASFISGVYSYPGRYLNDDGHLSSYNFLQDRDYYQNYSYVIKIKKALTEYKSYLEKITHPTGLKIFGEYILEPENDQIVYSNYITDSEILFRKGTYSIKNVANASNIKISFVGHSLTNNNNVYIEFIESEQVEPNTHANLLDIYADRINVTMSSVYGGYHGGFSIDGNTITFSATANGANEWYKLDLGATFDLDTIVLTNRDAGGNRLNGSVVQLLADSGAVIHSYDAITGATDGEVFTFEVPEGIIARSVYIDGAANQFLQIAEMDVYGNQTIIPNITDEYASQMNVTMSSVYSGFSGNYILDGNISTYCHTLNGPDEWINLNLGGEFDVSIVQITNRSAAGARLDGAVVQLLDGSGNVVHSFAPITGAEDGEVFTLNLPSSVTATQVRIDGAANQYLHIAEIDVYGVSIDLSSGLYIAKVTDNNTFYIKHASGVVSTNTGNVMFGRIV